MSSLWPPSPEAGCIPSHTVVERAGNSGPTSLLWGSRPDRWIAGGLDAQDEIGQFDMDWYYAIAWMALCAQVLFLYHAARNYRYALAKWKRRRPPAYRPPVTLIVPCKGLDVRLPANIASFLRQDYDNYRLLFVVEKETDPAYGELCRARESLRSGSKALDVQVLVAGPSTSCSQKIHNLLYALDRVTDDTEVLAFADSDVCVRQDWLARLVQPLRRAKHGAATGYRWFVPLKNNPATLAMSAMNASVAQLLGNSRLNQAWGGSMAVRVADFRRLNLPQLWRNTLSDDLSLTRAVKDAGMRVTFVPGCLVASFESTTWRGLCEFARRQFLITRVYSPGPWWAGFFSSLGSVAGLWGSAGLAVYAMVIGAEHVFLYVAVPVAFLIGHVLRAVLRQSMAMTILAECRAQLRLAAAADILGSWLWSLLLFVLILSSAFGRTIRWRGIRYKLLGPARTVVLTAAVHSEQSNGKTLGKPHCSTR